MPNGLIAEDSLRVHPEGLALSLTLPWYRSLWLSSVGTLKVTIDGVEVLGRRHRVRAEGRALHARPAARAERGALVPAGAPAAHRAPRGADRARRDARRRDLSASCACPTCRSRPGRTADRACTCRTSCGSRSTLTATDRDAAPPALVSDVPPPPPATDADPFKLGLTLYSASAEFRAGWFDFDGLLDRVAELGIGPGIEIVASQVLPTYPIVSDEFVHELAGRVRQARIRRELVRRQPRHGPAPRPRHDPRRGVRVQRGHVPGSEEARLPARAHPERQARAAAPSASGRREARTSSSPTRSMHRWARTPRRC